MSADEVLASNLWSWPDPLLKRDQMGQVVFVNAAFLHLYGGNAQDWFGKPVSGWPAPASNGAQRFETRIGLAPNENVFDWVESVMADGNVMAIARNVSIFMGATPASAEEFVPEVQQTQTQSQAPSQACVQNTAPDASTPDVSPPDVPTPDVSPPPMQAQQAAPDLSSELEKTLDKQADEYAYKDNQADNPAGSAGPTGQATVSATPTESAAIPAPIAEQMAFEPQATAPAPTQQTVTNTAVPAPEQAVQAPTPSAPKSAEEPMIERRALPIKDSTSILGSNWRDQVIAKAVGDPEIAETNPNTDAPVAHEAEQEQPRPGAGLKILLAEDNAINALLTRTLLESEGAEVDTVEDGVLALQAVGKKKYDMVFMDMRMPNMDGLESTRKIRAYGSTMPIIALTANAFDDDRNACFDSGMNDFMTKPVSAEELSEMVVNWTNKDSQAQRMAG